MTKYWQTHSSLKARTLKADLLIPRYLSSDPKPAVCIRARLRLSVALTPRRKLIYRLVDNDLCCGQVGDTEHVIMHCTKFTDARRHCTTQLSNLYTPVTLSLRLVLGLPPPLPPDISLHNEKSYLRKLHDSCLLITAQFLHDIDRISPL